MDPDDIAYSKSVRNMSLILVVIVITVFAAIFILPYVNPYHEVFQPSVSLGSPFGFTLHLNISSTSVAPLEVSSSWGGPTAHPLPLRTSRLRIRGPCPSTCCGERLARQAGPSEPG